MRAAADLIARLSRTSDGTSLVKELAAVSYDVTDRELGAAIKQAPEVLAALDSTNWPLLRSVRGFAERNDGVGDKADRLIIALHDAVNDHELTRSLVPVLSRLQDESVALVTEAARLATVAQPPAAQPPEQGPEDISLTRHGRPVVPSRPPPQLGFAEPKPTAPLAAAPVHGPSAPHVVDTTRLTGLESALTDAIADVRDEICSYAAGHPGVRIEIAWRPVSAEGRIAADEEAAR
ncbi:hypothetical protein ACFRKD_28270 [Streptomyces niveus]|uniref:hypothetical protein n=1 Tax=Streptomyces niveus TaxID=193462 RepID=UPI0036882FCC